MTMPRGACNLLACQYGIVACAASPLLHLPRAASVWHHHHAPPQAQKAAPQMTFRLAASGRLTRSSSSSSRLSSRSQSRSRSSRRSRRRPRKLACSWMTGEQGWPADACCTHTRPFTPVSGCVFLQGTRLAGNPQHTASLYLSPGELWQCRWALQVDAAGRMLPTSRPLHTWRPSRCRRLEELLEAAGELDDVDEVPPASGPVGCKGGSSSSVFPRVVSGLLHARGGCRGGAFYASRQR